ncbi:MAG: hypothetical protein ABIE81_04880 [Candidatus Omnitrophota bacterium]
MKIYSKNIYLHNIKLNFKSDCQSLFNAFCEELKFPKFRSYNKYIEIDLNLSVKNKAFKNGRSDVAGLKDENFSLDCWIKNISLEANPKENKINAKLLYPSSLTIENLLHLTIISPLRRILTYYNISLIHSAVVSKKNKALLICGGPGMGKSTLAAALIDKGYNFLSDEFAILHKDRILSFPLKMKLDKQSLKFLTLNEGRKIATSFYAQEYFPAKPAERACLGTILFICQSDNPLRPPELKKLKTKESFTILAYDKVNSLPEEKNITIRQRQIQSLCRLACQARSYALSYSLDQIKEIPKLLGKLL